MVFLRWMRRGESRDDSTSFIITRLVLSPPLPSVPSERRHYHHRQLYTARRNRMKISPCGKEKGQSLWDTTVLYCTYVLKGLCRENNERFGVLKLSSVFIDFICKRTYLKAGMGGWLQVGGWGDGWLSW